MKILFYRNSLNKSEIVSPNVHILEVLNNLSNLGHSVSYANGEHHSFIVSSQKEVVSQPLRKKSYWEKVKIIIWNSPFRGEALISIYFITEIKLFLSAFRTVLRFKPDIIYRRHELFNSEYLLSRICKIPCIVEVNGIVSYESEINKKLDSVSLWLINNFERHNFKRADKYIVVTPILKDILVKDYHISSSKIVVIENGANTDLSFALLEH
jgi:hypothetical protein